MADELEAPKFPRWHQPDPNIGAVLVLSQEELDEYEAAGWPHGKAEEEAAAETADAPAKKKPGRKPKA